MKRTKALSLERIHECFHVDLEMGRLYWKNVSKYHAEKKGKEAGTPTPSAKGKIYWTVGVDGIKRKRAHIIFAVANGYWSEQQVIHDNSDSLDDRPGNLREAEHHGSGPSSAISAGQRFGILTAKSEVGRSKDNHRMWLCACDCGGEKVMQSNSLQLSRMPSCGCLTAKLNGDAHKTHGMRNSPEYSSWRAMLARCHCETDKDYPRYGAKGIAVCPEWRESFEAFYAHIGPRPDGTTVDRIKNHLGYEPGNVRWANAQTQCRNRNKSAWVMVDGEVIHLKDYADQIGITLGAAHLRLKRGQLSGVERV